ncbi:hypothetical protein ACFQO1_00435 [Jejudonia soesokkakensis]|uniref:Oligosaccharide repeat unit polymerase n=1 Tax=Jejudonia soesokkakensis TaxID=1323432 RepID=A0ABW2MQH2_9FLAO
MILEGFFIYNLFLALYLLIPTLLLITSTPPKRESFFNKDYFKLFFKIFTYTLFIVNISAAIYAVLVLATTEYPDDIFTGLYGTSGFGSHSLSVVNLLVATYYFFIKKFQKFAFFFVCGILGFYGLGLMIFILAFAIVLLPILLKNVATLFKVIFIGISFFAVVYVINPGNFDYIRVNIAYVGVVTEGYDYQDEINKMKRHRRTWIPRYITFLDGSRRLLFENPKVLLLGTSPGTYNSRTAFYLNGDFIGNDTFKKLFNYRTDYHRNYVMPILNRNYLENSSWNDGTRNQPFSSLVSIIVEYGLIIGSFILFLFFSSISKARKVIQNKGSSNFVKFIFFYCILLFLFQFYFEVVEILLPMILMVKLLEFDQINKNGTINADPI